jgi:hypothetical protein
VSLLRAFISPLLPARFRFSWRICRYPYHIPASIFFLSLRGGAAECPMFTVRPSCSTAGRALDLITPCHGASQIILSFQPYAPDTTALPPIHFPFQVRCRSTSGFPSSGSDHCLALGYNWCPLFAPKATAFWLIGLWENLRLRLQTQFGWHLGAQTFGSWL